MENESKDRSCQHSQLSEFNFLHHDIESKALFSHMCNRYRDALIFLKKTRKAKAKSNAGIIGANSSKIHLVSYSGYA